MTRRLLMDMDQRVRRVERNQEMLQKEVLELSRQSLRSNEMNEQLLQSLCEYQKQSTEYQKETTRQLKEMGEMFRVWNDAKGFWRVAKFISSAVKVFVPIFATVVAVYYYIKSGKT